MNKKILSTILVAGMLTGMLSGCGGTGSSSGSTGSTGSTSASTASKDEGGFKVTMNPAGYPECSEPYQFSVLSTYTVPEGHGAWETPNEIPMFKNYAEKTNMTLDWELVTTEQFLERLNILIAGDELPEMIMKPRNLTSADIVKHGTSGLFQNIEPLLPEYAPDFYKYIEERDLTKFLRMADGIWGFPYIYDSDGITISKIFINTRWMKNVGVEAMPTTLDDYYNLMVKFRDEDANGNGDKADEIPFGAYNWSDFISTFRSAYKLGNRGSSNAYVDEDPAAEGKVRLWIGADEMKDLLKMYKKYYDDGLISKNIFDTDWGTQFSNYMNTDIFGMHDLWTTVAPPNLIDEFLTTEAPPQSPDGSTFWASAVGKLGSKGSLIVTKNAKHPEAIVGWANYFYTQQGAYDYFLGIEGESYTIDENGNTHLTELMTKNPNGLTQEQAILRYSMYSGGGNPGLATDQTFKGGETYWTSLEGNEKYKKYMPETLWEAISMTAEQSAEVSSVKGDLDAVYKEYVSKFVTGVVDIDAGWDEYQKKLDQAGRERYTKAYEDALAALK